MIHRLYIAVRERCWNRDRKRRIAEMQRRELAIVVAEVEWEEAMATQLAEIRGGLPETNARAHRRGCQ